MCMAERIRVILRKEAKEKVSEAAEAAEADSETVAPALAHVPALVPVEAERDAVRRTVFLWKRRKGKEWTLCFSR